MEACLDKEDSSPKIYRVYGATQKGEITLIAIVPLFIIVLFLIVSLVIYLYSGKFIFNHLTGSSALQIILFCALGGPLLALIFSTRYLSDYWEIAVGSEALEIKYKKSNWHFAFSGIDKFTIKGQRSAFTISFFVGSEVVVLKTGLFSPRYTVFKSNSFNQVTELRALIWELMNAFDRDDFDKVDEQQSIQMGEVITVCYTHNVSV